MERRGTGRWLAPLVMAGAVLVGCGDAADDVVARARSVADEIAERGVGAVAEGRWRCSTDEVDDGPTRRITTVVSIAADGRFSYVAGDATDLAFSGENADRMLQTSGTWEVDGLRLRLSIPWYGDGYNGFHDWTYQADAEAPTHLSGKVADDRAGGHEFDVDLVSLDEIRLVQHDVEGPEAPNYDWDVTCTRTSSDPGRIAPTVPPSDGGD